MLQLLSIDLTFLIFLYLCLRTSTTVLKYTRVAGMGARAYVTIVVVIAVRVHGRLDAASTPPMGWR